MCTEFAQTSKEVAQDQAKERLYRLKIRAFAGAFVLSNAFVF
jgi:hypothetical protein